MPNLAFDFSIPPVDPRREGCTAPVQGKTATSDAVKNRRAGHAQAAALAKSQQHWVLSCYQDYGPMTDAEVRDALGWERSTVNARRNELMKAGLVQEVGSKKNLQTGVQNTLYGLVQP